MNDPKNPLITPLVIAATLSVISFSGIGVAAITGHLSITHSSLNPFSNFSKSSASGMIQAPLLNPTEGHQGLTRKRGETLAEGKSVNYQFGARVPVRKPAVCADCGVVDSIIPGHARTPNPGIARSLAAGSEGATILKVAGKTRDEQESHEGGFVVTVHMENGTVRTIYESERPPFNIGERIKLVNGSVIRRS